MRSSFLFVITKWNDYCNTMCRRNCAIGWFITYNLVHFLSDLITLHGDKEHCDTEIHSKFAETYMLKGAARASIVAERSEAR